MSACTNSWISWSASCCPASASSPACPTAWDGRGNYTLGFKEQTVFPEIEFEKVDKLRGLEVSIVTTARTDEEGRQLLELLGMPFTKD